MKKFSFALGIALGLIISSEVFANSFNLSLTSDRTQNLNCLRYFYAQNQSTTDTGNSKQVINKNLQLKDPNMALVYAAVPGFIVHGAGHFYAGNEKTGFVLLGIEFVGILLGGIGTLREFGEAMGAAEESPSPDLYLLGAAILFFGTWTYDLIQAPSEVRKYNEQLFKNSSLKLEKKNNSLRFMITRHF